MMGLPLKLSVLERNLDHLAPEAIPEYRATVREARLAIQARKPDGWLVRFARICGMRMPDPTWHYIEGSDRPKLGHQWEKVPILLLSRLPLSKVSVEEILDGLGDEEIEEGMING